MLGIGDGWKGERGAGCRLTWLNVVPDDADVLVAVRPRVLVPEANHMTQLVHHDAKLVTVLANGDGLGTSAPPAHKRTAPNDRWRRKKRRKLSGQIESSNNNNNKQRLSLPLSLINRRINMHYNQQNHVYFQTHSLITWFIEKGKVRHINKQRVSSER